MPATDHPAAPSGTPPDPSDRQPPRQEELTALSESIAASFRAAAECQRAELWHTEQYAELLPLLDTLIAETPADADLHLQKGICLIDLRRCREALAVLETAERLAPQDLGVLLFQAEALLGVGDFRQAERLTRQLLAAIPDDSFFQYRLAVCAALAGKPRQALRELSLAIARNEDWRRGAALDPAFDSLRSLPAFRKLIAATG